MKNQAHIPTLLALLILFIGLGSAIFLVETGPRLFSRAKENIFPREITVSNVTDSGFTINWLTDEPVVGSIEYEEKSVWAVPKTAGDVRDQEQTLPRYSHSVRIDNTKAATLYSVTLLHDRIPDQNRKLTVKTGIELSIPTHVIDPAFGSIVYSTQQSNAEALAFASFGGSQTVSTIVNADGSWIIPLNLLRSADGNRYYIPDAKETETIYFVSRDARSTVKTTTDDDSPLPSIRLGENFDFTKEQTLRNRTIIAQSQQLSQINGTVNADSFNVTLPVNGAFIPSGKPAFKGTGFPGEKVFIVLSGPSQTVTAETVVATNGTWNYTPNQPLTPQRYVGSFTSYDQSNRPLAQALVFTVLKSGSSVLADATPSALLASPTPLPSVTPVPSTRPSPTPVGSPIVSPPISGTTDVTVGLTLAAVAMMLMGSLLFIRVYR